MKKINLLLFLFFTGLLFFFFLNLNKSDVSENFVFEEYSSSTETDNLDKSVMKFKKVSKQERIDKAIEQEWRKTRDLATGEVPRERLIEARKQIDAYKINLQNQRAALPIDWTERGPNNVGGRTRAILVDAADLTNNTVYAAGVGGGIWKTTNFLSTTPTWVAIDDFFNNIAITCIAQDPNNSSVLYFGTGEGWFNADAIRGLGIWKSTNGGNTWTQLTSTNNSNFYYVQDLLVDGSSNVLAATQAGVRRSTDGGSSWTQVLGSSVGAGATNRAADLEIGTDGNIYASLGIFSTGSVWRATDGAAGTWTNITPPLPGGVTAWNRIELATAQDGNTVYAVIQASGSNNAEHLFSSTNDGTNWTTRVAPDFCDQGTTTNFTRSQGWYDLILAVSPSSATTIYVGGVDALRSTDSGQNWSQITSWTGGFGCSGLGNSQYVHADHHSIVPISATSIIWGSDGGISHTTNATSSPPTFADKNIGYNVTQFYACAMHPSLGQDYFLAGAQDNGTQKFNTAGMNNTTRATGGDGAFCHIDQDNSNIQITSYVYNNYYISTNGGTSFSSRSFGNTGDFINPTDYDNTANILYGGHNAGQFFRWNDPATAGTSTSIVSVSNFSGGFVTHVAVSPNTTHKVFFGLDNGDIVRVDGANSSTSYTGTVIRNGTGSVSCIAIEEGNDDHLLVTYSNYGVVSVFETLDGGSNWTSVEGNLPDMPVRWAIFAPQNNDQALLATELGVWSTDNLNGSSTNWAPSVTGLANTRVDMLQYRTSDNLVAAATHGRGLFTTDYFSGNTCNFSSATSTQEESGISTPIGPCNERYINVNIPVSILNDPNVTANVDISIDPSSTATANKDFVFTSPTTLNFTIGGAKTQNITVSIIDDAIVEGNETIVLNLNVTNPGTSGVTNGTIAQHTITITDNDEDPISGSATTIATLFSENFESSTFGSFANGSTSWSRASFGASACSGCGWTFSTNSPINGRSAHVTENTSTNVNTYNLTAINDLALVSPVIDASAVSSTMTLSFDFKSAGESGFDYGRLLYATTANFPSFAPFTGTSTTPFVSQTSPTTYSVSLPAALQGQQFHLLWRWTSDDNTGDQPPFTIDDVAITYETVTNIGVETTLQTRSAQLGVGNTAHFYSTNGDIVASVTQTSGTDIGCITASIDRTGTGRQSIFGTKFVSDKTFLVTADNNANYNITLYYTDAELSVWGASKSSLNVLKSTGAISAATTVNSTIATPTAVQTYGTSNHIAYTASFNSFSGFALSDATPADLPVELLTFTGELKNNFIELNWSTATEKDNNGFDIERSIDGVNFYKIDFVKGVGNSTIKQNYNYPDFDLISDLHYYRLKQIDNDGSFKYSKTITVKIPKTNSFTVFPNPFKDNTVVQFNNTIDNKDVIISIYGLDGKQLLTSKHINVSTNTLVLNDELLKLSIGTYLLKIEIDGKLYATQRIVKQK